MWLQGLEGEGWRVEAERDGSWRWGCPGSLGPGNDEPGGVGEEPRCSAWLMRRASYLQPSPPLFTFNLLLFCFLLHYSFGFFLCIRAILFPALFLTISQFWMCFQFCLCAELGCTNSCTCCINILYCITQVCAVGPDAGSSSSFIIVIQESSPFTNFFPKDKGFRFLYKAVACLLVDVL